VTQTLAADHPATCVCRGSGWVCEDHPTVPYASETQVTCWCDAPGMPCGYQAYLRRQITAEIAAAADRHWRILTARDRSPDRSRVRRMAEDILATLPAEPLDDVLAHCKAINVPGPGHRTAAEPAPPIVEPEDLTPWRTPREAAWTDAEMRAARAKRNRGEQLTGAEHEARRAYDRIAHRRHAASRGAA
jgi:hypothetical protein